MNLSGLKYFIWKQGWLGRTNIWRLNNMEDGECVGLGPLYWLNWNFAFDHCSRKFLFVLQNRFRNILQHTRSWRGTRWDKSECGRKLDKVHTNTTYFWIWICQLWVWTQPNCWGNRTSFCSSKVCYYIICKKLNDMYFSIYYISDNGWSN